MLQKENDKELTTASVASRAKFYNAREWYNASCKLSNENVAIFSSGFLIWLLSSQTLIVKNLTKNSYLTLANNNLAPRHAEILEIGVDLTLIVSLLLILKFFGRLNLLRFFPGYSKEHGIDPFDHSLLEESCLLEIETLQQSQRQSFIQAFFKSRSLYTGTLTAMILLPISSSTRNILIAIVATHVRAILHLLSNVFQYFPNQLSSNQMIELGKTINEILQGSNVKLALSPEDIKLLKETNVTTSLYGQASSMNKNLIYLKLQSALDSSALPGKDSDENYYIMMIIKRIIETSLEVEVLALDDQALLMQLKKIQQPQNIFKSNKLAQEKFTYFYKQNLLANKYLNFLNKHTTEFTELSWKKIFDANNEDLFSFSLNVSKVDNKDLSIVISKLKSALQSENIYIFGNKLVAEFKMKNKIPASEYAKLDKSSAQMAPSHFFMKRSPEILANEKRETTNSKEETKQVYKKIRPKISGKNNFLFMHQKSPQVRKITWQKFKSDPKIGYFPLSHACSNKIIFYSAMTLETCHFTTAEPLSMFLNILKTEVVRTSAATGSCIKFLLQSERDSLKETIRKLVADPKTILFKLHTKGDTRVYGVLRDEGLAEYDDGSTVVVKMIEWCVIDQKSHEKTSSGIFQSNHNPFLQTDSAHTHLLR